MAASMKNFCLLSLILVVLLLFVTVHSTSTLQDDYYSESCPDAEALIKSAVDAALDEDLSLAPALIRLQFHDCFVEGCDASVLLDGSNTEKTAATNQFLDGFDVIDAAKTAVEAVCPGVVSCADIVVYAARDSTVKVNGPTWAVAGGRKDGTVSSAEAAEANIPEPTFTATQLIASFAKKGLSTEEMVTLSGAHTVGVAHCVNIVDRLYNFNATYSTDPSLDPAYAAELMKKCPKSKYSSAVEVNMDTLTPVEFDSNYYVGLTLNKGLFTSDQTLYEDSRTKSIVEKLLSEIVFESKFGDAMIALAAVDVKTEGQIRVNCRIVNA